MHLAISLPVIFHEEASTWLYMKRLQMVEDFEKTAPPPVIHSGPMIEWRPCYEYRPSIADRLIFAVEFPSGMLIAPHGGAGCNPTLLQPLLQKLKRWMGVKTRIVLLDFLLLLGIAGQWWLLGRWIDHLRDRRKHARRWIIPVATTTICGIVMAATAVGGSWHWEFAAIVLPLIALLAWLALLLMFTVTAVRWAIRFSRKDRATEHN
jgi:hypothetical protein